MDRDVLYAKNDGVAYITLNRPDVLNVFRWETVNELTEAFADAGKDRKIGVIVLTGKGRAFCCGGDISVLSSLDKESGREWNYRLNALAMLIRTIPKAVIAAVNGYCIGGGNELNLFCDLSIASKKAVFGQAGPKIGGCPLWGGTQLLPVLVGDKRAREIIMLCNQYTADQALAMGLINYVVEHENLEVETDKWARRILEMAPQSIELSKMALNSRLNLIDALNEGGALLTHVVWGSEQLKEGTAAFKEKRPTDYSRFRS